MTNPVDDLGNVKVDFVWGNMPLQPDDQRGENTLDPALDNHIIATSGYEGFPGFVTGGVFDDTVANVAVPVLTGVLAATAASRLTTAGLVGSVLATTTEGATSLNNGKVATQGTAAGTVVNVGSTVTYSVYEYVASFSGYTETNWTSFGTSVILDDILFADANAALLANPTNYVMTIAGSVDKDGTYPVTAVQTGNNAGYSGNMSLAITTATTFGYHTSGTEGGTVTVALA